MRQLKSKKSYAPIDSLSLGIKGFLNRIKAVEFPIDIT